jgi:L-lactate permease
MQPHPEPSAAEPSSQHIAQPATPRSDFIAALLWIAFGIAVAVGSWRMDRLENQDINPYTVPGLLPGLLGIALICFGALLLLRAWQQGALDPRVARGVPMSSAERKRLLIVLGLCLTFGVGLVGHGLPFWLAAAIFVSATIAILQYPQRLAANQVARGFATALAIGLGAGLAITLIFQEFFLVRLP